MSIRPITNQVPVNTEINTKKEYESYSIGEKNILEYIQSNNRTNKSNLDLTKKNIEVKNTVILSKIIDLFLSMFTSKNTEKKENVSKEKLIKAPPLKSIKQSKRKSNKYREKVIYKNVSPKDAQLKAIGRTMKDYLSHIRKSCKTEDHLTIANEVLTDELNKIQHLNKNQKEKEYLKITKMGQNIFNGRKKIVN